MKYFEDFRSGDTIVLGEYAVSEEEIISFAKQYDPQFFHCDPLAAMNSAAGGLIASGWHTGSIFMRLQCDAFLVDSASIMSPGLDQLRWLKPVRPGDTLSGSVEVIEARISQSRPDRGIVRCNGELSNQHKESVMTVLTAGFFALRNAE